MKKIYTLVIFIVIVFLNNNSSSGQTLYDSFADGDFTASPVWGGNTANWSIVANSDAAAGATGSNTLRFAGPATTTTEYLSSQISSWATAQEWGFFIGRRAQAFTSANQMYIWLYANESTLTSGTVDGYRIAIGDNGTGDAIRLEYIVNGALSSTVISSSGLITNNLTDIGFLLRVTRSNIGDWEIFTSTLPTANGNGAIASDIPNSTNANVSQGTANNNILVPSSNGYIGLAALHSTGAVALAAVELDQIYFTATTPATIAAPTFTTPVCLSYGGATFPVSFTSTGTFTANTYNVELSNASGAFSSPTIIGSTISNANTITNLSCTIPYGTAGGTGYLIRVTGNGPATIGTNSVAFTISTNSVSPLTTQNTSPGVNGGTLTVTDYTASTLSWKYGTVSGGPYGSSLGGGPTQQTSFPFTGTYYVVCTNTYATCGLVTSAETQVNVTMPSVTSPSVTNACIDLETVNWTLPAGFSVTNNSILVFAKAGSAVTQGTPTNAVGTYTANTIFGNGSPYQNDASAFCVYNGTSNTVNVSGLTANTTYHYLILNVQNSPTVYASGATAAGTTLASVPNVTGLTVTPANGELIIGWTMASCFDDVLVIVTDNASVTASPSGDGTQYVDYSVYGDVTSNVNLPANEYDVYQGTGTTVTVSGLVNLTTYRIKIFTRKGTTWSSGTIGSGIPNTTTGDFQTLTSGNWTDYTTWQRYNGSTWVNAVAGEFPNLSNYAATILSGHTVTLDGSGPYAVSTLTVQSGGKLYTNQASPNIYISIFSQIVCNGTIGNYPTDDAIAFNIEGVNCTLTGTGTFACSRIKKDFTTNSTSLLTISMNVNLTWPATVLYNNQAGTTFNTTINSPYVVSTRATMGNVSVDGTAGNGSGNMRGVITVKGTLNVNGKLFLTTDNGTGAGNGLVITGTGTVNVDSVDAAASGGAGHTLNIQNGGSLNIYGADAFYNFSNTNNVYNCFAGSTIEYSASAPQTIQNGIYYHHLTCSGSNNKTTTSSGVLTIYGDLKVDAAIFNVPSVITTFNVGGNITLQNGGTMNDNCKSYLNISIGNSTSNQTFTGNGQIIKCLNLTSVKTAGSLVFAGASGNTDVYILNDLMIDHSGTAILTDNGNTISIGDDAQLGGGSSTTANFNLSGTLKFICLGAAVATDIHLSNFAGTGVTVARPYNLIIDAAALSQITEVQIFPSGGGQTITINGNLAIQNTNAFSNFLNPNNNTISLKGNWNNYNQAGFTEGTGQLILSGTTLQTINCTETFYNLELNNSNGAIISNNIIVSNELKLTNGTLSTGTNEVQVTNNAVGSVTGFSISSWVNGNLRRNVAATGNYNFPVGDVTNYQLATVNLNSSTGMSSIVAFFNTTITGTAPSYPTTTINGDGIYGILNSGFWTITPNAYTAVNYDITLNQRGYSNFAGNANQLGIIKRANSGASWGGTNLSGSNGFHNNATQIISGGAATAVRTGVTAFSDFAEGFGGQPLPVTLSSFTLMVIDNKRVELKWNTEAEINCDYYSVERSIDANTFSSIGTVSGHMTTDQPHSYQFTDFNPVCSEAYYRLREVDFSSEVHSSNILSADISCNDISMHPNLVLDKISFRNLKDNSIPIKIVITNIEGKKFIENTIAFRGEDFQLDVSSLASGLYFVQLLNGNQNFVSRFIKE